jgi:hypothetical protein
MRTTTSNAQCATRDGDEMVLKGLKAHGRVVGRMLDMTLEQTYLNPEDRNVEVVYTFPLPHGAVLLGIEVTLNGETLHGKVSAKAAAREKYEDALTEGHTALLLTVQPDGTHTLELGNLLAHETAVVKLTYVQVLKPEQGSLRLTLPTTLAPRYGDAVSQGGYDPHAVPETSTTVEYPFDLVMRIEGELAMARIGSPSHPIQLQLLPAIGAGQTLAQEVRAGPYRLAGPRLHPQVREPGPPVSGSGIVGPLGDRCRRQCWCGDDQFHPHLAIARHLTHCTQSAGGLLRFHGGRQHRGRAPCTSQGHRRSE